MHSMDIRIHSNHHFIWKGETVSIYDVACMTIEDDKITDIQFTKEKESQNDISL